ncbi:putative ribonuclease H-like domain-containing protein [Tanacetum coccineum]
MWKWVEAMQEELLQFKLLNVWTLVDLPHGKKVIGTKWVFRNKRDQRGFTVYQMDVKSAFLYGTIEEELRAWYETLSTYLLENGFRRGSIDKTLFIKKIKNDILLVQVYVDDIFFGITKESLSNEFEQLMHKRFQMSSMGELAFFLGLQVKQRKDGIFLSQDKYVYDILKKMVQKPVINNRQRGTGQREVRPVWNNAMRTNHKNFSNSRRNIAPTAVLTKFGIVPITRQSSPRAAVPVTKGNKVTSVVGEQGINVVKSSACWVWRPKRNVIDHISKNSGSYICKPFDYVDPTGRLNGCSRHMTGNKSYLIDYQDYDEGFVAFAGSSKGGSDSAAVYICIDVAARRFD